MKLLRTIHVVPCQLRKIQNSPTSYEYEKVNGYSFTSDWSLNLLQSVWIINYVFKKKRYLIKLEQHGCCSMITCYQIWSSRDITNQIQKNTSKVSRLMTVKYIKKTIAYFRNSDNIKLGSNTPLQIENEIWITKMRESLLYKIFE